MKKMIEMDCCDCCGKPFYCAPEDVTIHDVMDKYGEVHDLTICDDCLYEKHLYTTCDFCRYYLKIDDCININDDEYCPRCAEKAIEELEDNVREAKRQLADAKAAFERRKSERE